MVPAALVILVATICFLILWLHDRQELKRVKRDVARLRTRLDKLEGIVASEDLP